MNFSIIIPYYNSSDTIGRMIKSIPTRDDTEILIVDDCSEDQEYIKLKDIASEFKTNNIVVIRSKENKGAGHARNLALRKAKGKWLVFADADDYFLPYLSSAMDKYAESDFDTVYFSATSVMEHTGLPSKRHEAIERWIINASSGEEKYIDELKYKFYGPVCKFVRSKIVRENTISFQETHAFNDALFSVKVGYFSEKVKIDISPIYCITECGTSVSFTCSEKIIKSRILAIRAVNGFYRDKSIRATKMRILPHLIYARKLGVLNWMKILIWFLKN